MLERAYAGRSDPDDIVYPVYEKIIETSNAELLDPQNPPAGRSARGVINDNSAVAQSRAFVALVTYVLEQNGYTADDYQITPGSPDPKRV